MNRSASPGYDMKPNVDILIRRDNREYAAFSAPDDTDISRGNILLEANAAAKNGDLIEVGCGNFDVQKGNAAGALVVFTSTSGVNWRGQGWFSTLIGSSVATCEVFHPAGKCNIDDIQFAALQGAAINECFLPDIGTDVVVNNCWLNGAVWFYGGTAVINNSRLEASLTLSGTGSDCSLFNCRQFYSGTAVAINLSPNTTYRAFNCDLQNQGNSNSNNFGTSGNGNTTLLVYGGRLWLIAGTGYAVGFPNKISGTNTAKLVGVDIVAPAGGQGVLCQGGSVISLIGGQTSGPTGTAGTALHRTGGTLNVGNHTYPHSNTSGTIVDLNA